MGPRLLLFLLPADRAAHGRALDEALTRQLPASFTGYPTHASVGIAPELMTDASVLVRHRVVITDLQTWSAGWLGFDPRGDVGLLDWLATPTPR